jgi:hypothetical protein
MTDSENDNDSVMSEDGVAQKDLEYLVDLSVKDAILERRQKRKQLKVHSMLEKNAIEDILVQLERIKNNQHKHPNSDSNFGD